MTNQSPPAQNAATDGGAVATASSAAARRIGRRREDRIVGASEANQLSLEQAIAAARSKQTVAITGPSGSGKTHVARAIHSWSGRAEGPFVIFSVHGVAAGEHLRQLFGASSADPGALERAAAGSLLITGIDALEEGALAALARALHEGQFTRESGGETIALAARVLVSTTNTDRTGLRDVPVHRVDLTSLGERPEDIAPLAAHFLALFAEEEGVTPIGFTPDARTWLGAESWVGNVRELRERVRQAVRLSGDGAISAEALMLSSEGDDVPSFKEAKRAFETRYVEGLLRRCGGNISRAARLAKKDRKDFYDVIRRTGVKPSEFRS